MADSCHCHAPNMFATSGQYNLGHIAAIRDRAWSCEFCRLVVAALEMEDAYDPHQEYCNISIYAETRERCIDLTSWGHAIRPATMVETSAGIDVHFQKTIRPVIQASERPADWLSCYRWIAPGSANYSLIRQWREICRDLHVDFCSAPPWLGITQPSNLRVIDVRQRAVVLLPEGCIYAALSYVWGAIGSLGHVSSEDDLACLPHVLPPVGQMPKTIEDAIQATRGIGLDYLWVDAICIAQEPFVNPDKIYHLAQMGTIFKAAEVVIVAATSESVWDGIFNRKDNYRQNIAIRSPSGDQFAIEKPELDEYLRTTAWSRRAWTFQEKFLARRLLVFGHHESYWSCQCDVWRETITLDRLPERRVNRETAPGIWEWQPCPPGQFPEDPTYPPARVLNLGLPDGLHTMQAYIQLIQDYTQRKVGHPSDGVNAVSGLLDMLQGFDPSRWNDLHWGIPAVFFDAALLWQPTLTCERVPAIKWRQEVPSWSWAGWSSDHMGGVRWDESLVSPWGARIAVLPAIKWFMLQCDGTSVPVTTFPRKSSDWEQGASELTMRLCRMPCGVEPHVCQLEPPLRRDLNITAPNYYLHFLTTSAQFQLGNELTRPKGERFAGTRPPRPLTPYILLDRAGQFAGSIQVPREEGELLRASRSKLDFIFFSYNCTPERCTDLGWEDRFLAAWAPARRGWKRALYGVLESVLGSEERRRMRGQPVWAAFTDFRSYDVLVVMRIARGPSGVAERLQWANVLKSAWLRSGPRTEWIVLG